MKKIGWAIDWERAFSTHDPSYYKWTQWLFLALVRRRPGVSEGRAREMVSLRPDRPGERTGEGRTLRALRRDPGRVEEPGAVVLHDHGYADELLDDLAGLDWPDRVKSMQRHWIGRSEGAEIVFRIEELGEDVPVFTTRPRHAVRRDVLHGGARAPAVERIANDEVREYVSHAAAKRAEERAAAEEKTGVFTGYYAVNPVNGERLRSGSRTTC